jgi:drug/metabolite transporter (DMT)-like permease
VLLGERPGLAQLAGGLLIVVALALTGGGDGEMEAGSAPAAVASRGVYGSNDGDPIGGISSHAVR